MASEKDTWEYAEQRREDVEREVVAVAGLMMGHQLVDEQLGYELTGEDFAFAITAAAWDAAKQAWNGGILNVLDAAQGALENGEPLDTDVVEVLIAAEAMPVDEDTYVGACAVIIERSKVSQEAGLSTRAEEDPDLPSSVDCVKQFMHRHPRSIHSRRRRPA